MHQGRLVGVGEMRALCDLCERSGILLGALWTGELVGMTSSLI